MNQALRPVLIIAALISLLISFGLAYLLFPLIKKLEAKGVRRHHAVIGIFGLFLVVFVIALILIIPGLVADAKAFVQELPESTSRALVRIEGLAAKFGYELDLSTESIRTYIVENGKELSGGILKGFTAGIAVAFTGVTKWLISILSFFLIPLFFFYVINDYEKISAEIKSFIPQSFRPKMRHYFDLSNRVLSGYIRGQLMVALVLAGLYAIGLASVGLRFGILIGLVTGLLSIIPYAGFTIGFLTAMLVGLANHAEAGVLIGVVAVFAVVQALEGTVITPRLVGNKVGLSPLATMLALIVGGNIAGLGGMLIAIPTAAIAKSVLAELKQEYQKLEIYR
jgi:predicted PurR-regulated permease PerM